MKKIIVFLCACTWTYLLTGQSDIDSIMMIKFPPIQIEAPRIKVEILRSPVAVSKLEVNSFESANQNQGLNEYLNAVPGVFAMNQNNSAQDARIAIRGFGARSAFGIRGIKIIVNDIPFTTPDGQGQVDNILFQGIKSIEVLKGASSALYGNAAGGVIHINTFDEDAPNFLYGDFAGGSFGNLKGFLSAKTKIDQVIVQSQVAYNDILGYRDHSQSRNVIANNSIMWRPNDKQKIEYIFNILSSPIGDDPGSLTLAALENDRTAANPNNIKFNAGESITQLTHAVKYNHRFTENHILNLNAFASTRNLDNFLPFENGGAVDLTRIHYGFNSSYQRRLKFEDWSADFIVGANIEAQNDSRKRYNNEEGDRGELTLDQDEIYINPATYFSSNFNFRKYLITGGIRYDQNRINLKDNFLVDGDDSGALSIPVISPSLSWSYNISDYQFLYTSYSFAFESPTLTELTTNPTNTGGLNLEVKPQQTHSFEAGFKRRFKEGVQVLLSFYALNTNDEILPYEIAGFPGRTFYQNSGRTRRTGMELEFHAKLIKPLDIILSYNFGDFKFVEYDIDGESMSGNRLPGVPLRSGFAQIKYTHKGWHLEYAHRMFSEIFVDNKNSLSAPGFNVGNFRFSKTMIFQGRRVVPYIGINNIFDTEYYDNIRINAFGGRFFETAPGRNFYFGLKFDFLDYKGDSQ